MEGVHEEHEVVHPVVHHQRLPARPDGLHYVCGVERDGKGRSFHSHSHSHISTYARLPASTHLEHVPRAHRRVQAGLPVALPLLLPLALLRLGQAEHHQLRAPRLGHQLRVARLHRLEERAAEEGVALGQWQLLLAPRRRRLLLGAQRRAPVRALAVLLLVLLVAAPLRVPVGQQLHLRFHKVLVTLAAEMDMMIMSNM